jgi:hypothetical protein
MRNVLSMLALCAVCCSPRPDGVIEPTKRDVSAAQATPALPIVGPEFGMDQPLLVPGPSGHTGYGIASDGDGTSLVVWGAGGSIFAARVTEAGTVLDPSGILIAGPADNGYPKVTHDGSNWLVVWRDRSTETGGIYAARLNAEGTVLDEGFPVAAGAYWHDLPVVSSTHAGSLVAWTDGRNGIDQDLYVARVRPDGEVLDPGGIPVSVGAGSPLVHSISFDGTTSLVVWTDGPALRCQRIGSDGATLDGSGVTLTTLPSTTATTRSFSASSDGSNWLVAWTVDPGNGGSSDVYAMRVNADGTPDPTPIPLASSAVVDEHSPGVSHDGTHWLVAWIEDRTSVESVYGTRVSADGSVLSPGALLISPNASQRPPVVTHDGTNWLVAWDFGILGVHARRVGPSGAALDTTDIQVTRVPNQQGFSAASYNGADWLVVWVDWRKVTEMDIYGTRVSPAGEILDPAGIPIATRAENQQNPAVGFDGTDWFVVWQHESRNDDDIHGARVSADGAVRDADGIPIATTSADEASPRLSFDGTSWLVVYDAGDILGKRVSKGGSVLDATPITIAPGSKPSLSHDGTNWLVVWNHVPSPNSATAVYGARVNAGGALLASSPFRVAVTANASAPAVSHDGVNWLVLWAESFSVSSEMGIRGTRVNSSGAVLNSTGTLVSAPGCCSKNPKLAFDGTAYFAVWQRDNDIFGTRVRGSNTIVSGNQVSIANASWPEEPAVAAGPAGKFLVTYGAINDTGVGTRIRAKVVDFLGSGAGGVGGLGGAGVGGAPAGAGGGGAGGGMGGAPAGAGGGGAGGGMGGAPAGAGGAAGSSLGGFAGTGGMTAGMGGVGGQSGSSAAAGSASGGGGAQEGGGGGAGGEGDGGESNAGETSGGVGGTHSTGGADTVGGVGGAAGDEAAGEAGAHSGSPGMEAAGGRDDGDCSCRVFGSRGKRREGAAFLGLAVLAALRRRRTRSREALLR